MPKLKKTQDSKNKNCIRLKLIRKCMGMTLREFAKEIDVGFSTISQWENGTYPIPGPMVKLMDFYEEKLAKNNEKPKSTGISGKLPGNKSHDNG